MSSMKPMSPEKQAEYNSRFDQPIHVREDGNLYIGNYKCESPFDTPRGFLECDFTDLSLDPQTKETVCFNKAYNKTVYKKYGRRPYKTWYKLRMKHFLFDKYPEKIAKLAIQHTPNRGLDINDARYRFLLANKDLLMETYNDGLYNILPIVHAMGKSPHELKQFFGKAEWRKFSKLSYTFNKNNFTTYRLFAVDNKFVSLHKYRKTLPILGSNTREFWEHAARVSPTTKREHFWRTYHTISDTYRLGVNVNPDWSFKRVVEEHDAAVKRSYEKMYSTEPFLEKLVLGPFTRLVSPAEIYAEGSKMRHCVGSYSTDVAFGTYEVWHYSNNGEEATIGIRKHSGLFDLPTWQINQFYSYCNGPVSKEAKDHAEIFIKQFNKGRKERTIQSVEEYKKGVQTC